jgi:hypothetical protein
MKKYFLLFIVLNLAIILAYADFDDEEKLKIEKMDNHMRKEKDLLRHLDTSDDDEEEDSNDDEDSSSEDGNPTGNNTTEPTSQIPEVTLPTTPKETNKKYANVQIVGFNSFSAPPRGETIVFRLFVIYKNIVPSPFIIIRIAVNIVSSLRNLDEGVQEREANCTLDQGDQNKDQGDVRYNCKAIKKANETITNASALDATFSDPKLNSVEINYSEGAALEAAQLFKQTMVINKIFVLNNGVLTSYPDYFTITGEITDADFKSRYGITDSLILKVVDDSTDPSTSYNVSCTAKDNTNNQYEFTCTPEEGVKGTIFLSTITDKNNTAVSLNITRGKDTIDYSPNSTDTTTPNINRNAVYRKSSSGLSGGAIAGIVIACAVVLIVASLIAIMMKKSTVAAAPFQTQTPSIVGLRSVDNSTQ